MNNVDCLQKLTDSNIARQRERHGDRSDKVLQDFVRGFGGGVGQNVTKKGQTKKSVFGSDDEDDSEEEEIPERPPAKKVRKLDILLENLKREQALRGVDDGKSAEGEKDDEVLSTNLVIKHLAPDLDESIILHEFGRFGPIGSVKIMWPRDEEQRRRGWNTGFVAFMDREDAVKALNAMSDTLFHNHRLSMNWGDPVPLPEVPIWPILGGSTANPESTRKRAHDGPPPKEKVYGLGPDIIVKPPNSGRSRFLIDAMAVYVVRDGLAFEEAIMEREKDNKEFRFLFDHDSPEHIYYRWRVWSLCNGDTLTHWRVEPFLVNKNSSLWIPPPISLMMSLENLSKTDKHELGEKPLDKEGRNHLSHVLSVLNSERQSISNAMIYVIENADSCVEISREIIGLMTSGQTNAQKKLDLIYLISDILYNTSAPVRNASQYRAIIQDCLPDIFESLQETYATASSRIMQETVRKQVLRVLRVWREWHMFPDDFLNSLQCQFINKNRIDPSGNRKNDEIMLDVEYKRTLEEMDPVNFTNECRARAVSIKGTKEQRINKLLMVRSYTHHN